MTRFIARRERFGVVGSTNDVVRAWLADGTAEVCVAIADEQTSGRGRDGRRWEAPPGGSLLLSLGFRPTWLEPDRVWRLAAVASIAMAEAAEATVGLPPGTIRLKWPNDLVIVRPAPAAVGKVAGVLGETDGLGTADPRAVVGLGVNVDWTASDFPPDLAPTMTSLREAGAGRGVDAAVLLEAFLARLEPRVEALRAGRFDGTTWTGRQLTTGRTIALETADGVRVVRARDVDAESGALIVEDPDVPGGERHVLSGEVRHVRLTEPIAEVV